MLSTGTRTLSKLSIVTVIVTVALLVGLALFLKKTPIGVQMRAAAEDFRMARLCGVRTNQVIATMNGNQIVVIDGRSNTILRRITVGSENANVAVNSFTSRAYVTNETFSQSTVGVVNLLNSKVGANVSTGNNPFGVTVDIFSNLVFVTNLGDQTVAVVNGRTNTKISSVSANSDAIDVNPVSRLVYTSDPADGLVHVISE